MWQPITGLSVAKRAVAVNGQSSNRRSGYYRNELVTNNTSAAQWQSVTHKAVEGATTTTVTGKVFLAQSPEAFLHDLDGNLRSDGRWTNRWDAENRLILMTTPANLPTNAQKALRFTYDYQGRRVLPQLKTPVCGLSLRTDAA
jgi:hypothetical protein